MTWFWGFKVTGECYGQDNRVPCRLLVVIVIVQSSIMLTTLVIIIVVAQSIYIYIYCRIIVTDTKLDHQQFA